MGKYRQALFAILFAVAAPVPCAIAAEDTAVPFYKQAAALRDRGDIAGAERVYRQIVDLQVTAHGAESIQAAYAYDHLATMLLTSNRLAEAHPLIEHVLTIRRATLGDANVETITSVERMGLVLRLERRFADAVPVLALAHQQWSAASGPDSVQAARVALSIAECHWALQQWTQADPWFVRGLAASRAAHGALSETTLAAIQRYADFLLTAGRPADARARIAEIVAARLATGRAADEPLAAAYERLGAIDQKLGDDRAAIPALQEAHRIQVAARGATSIESLRSALSLVTSLRKLDRDADAAGPLREVVAASEVQYGKTHDNTLSYTLQLAELYGGLERHGDAEPWLRRAITILRSDGRPPSALLAATLASLGLVTATQGKAEATDHLRAAIAMYRSVDAPPDEQMVGAEILLGTLLGNARAFAEADRVLTDARTHAGIVHGPASPEARGADLALANLALARGKSIARKADAGEDGSEALSVEALFYKGSAALANDDPQTAVTVFQRLVDRLNSGAGPADQNYSFFAHQNLALALAMMDRFEEAEASARAAVAASANLPDVWRVSAYILLGRALYYNDRNDEAVATLKRAVDMTRTIGAAARQQHLTAAAFLANAIADADAGSIEGLAALREAADLLRRERSTLSSVSRALAVDEQARDPFNQIFGEILAEDWRLAPRLADRGRLQDEAFQAAQELLISAAGQAMLLRATRARVRDADALALIGRQQALAESARAMQQRIDDEASGRARPGGNDLRAAMDRTATELDQVEQALRIRVPDYFDTIRPQPVSIARVQALLAAEEALLVLVPADEAVFSLAITHDGFAWHKTAESLEAIERDAATLRAMMQAEPGEPYPAFDRARAYGLYRSLIAPVESRLRGRTQIFVTAGGELADLSLAMLVTEQPATSALIEAPAQLRETRWLGDAYAFISLPSIAALSVDRAPAPRTGRVPFIGYGGPVFMTLNASERAAPDDETITDHADPRRLAKHFGELAGAEAELKAIASALGAGQDAIRVRGAATETAFRADPRLPRARVIELATHGLLADQANYVGLDEPGIVFSPPGTPSATDDGVLTASEAAGLSLDADWVILSACNTASRGRGNPDNLSTLARAFLFAGARRLIASHWQVPDQATRALMVRTMTLEQEQPDRPHARHLQQAMQFVRQGGEQGNDGWAHPANWAGFALIAYSDRAAP